MCGVMESDLLQEDDGEGASAFWVATPADARNEEDGAHIYPTDLRALWSTPLSRPYLFVTLLRIPSPGRFRTPTGHLPSPAASLVVAPPSLQRQRRRRPARSAAPRDELRTVRSPGRISRTVAQPSLWRRHVRHAACQSAGHADPAVRYHAGDSLVRRGRQGL